VTSRRFRVDELADRLGDAADTFRARRDELLRALSDAKDAYDDAVLDAEDWAHKEGLIRSCQSTVLSETWTDANGEPFLPVAKCEVVTDPLPDLATMFRERVAELGEAEEQKGEWGDE
jgi:hypothetical protein